MGVSTQGRFERNNRNPTNLNRMNSIPTFTLTSVVLTGLKTTHTLAGAIRTDLPPTAENPVYSWVVDGSYIGHIPTCETIQLHCITKLLSIFPTQIKVKLSTIAEGILKDPNPVNKYQRLIQQQGRVLVEVDDQNNHQITLQDLENFRSPHNNLIIQQLLFQYLK